MPSHKAAPMTEIDIADDDALRFVQRVLESDAPREDRDRAAQMVRDIRTRVRKAYSNAGVMGTEAQRRDELSRTGHGHVVPRVDGAKTRCGGVMFCDKCKYEREYLAAAHGVEGRTK